MFSPQTLHAVSALHDLPSVVAGFGHEPLWEPFDPRAAGLARPADPEMEAAIVGCAGGFTWYGVASDQPARTAPQLARRLTDRGRTCGVLGLDARLRRLAVAVGADGAPVLEIDLDRPSRLATCCLSRIGGTPEGGALAVAARAAEAISGAGVGGRFYATFRATLERFTASLPAGIPERHRHELALLQLTRVLFLYFIQAKGWLDGSERFLRERVDDCLFRRRRIHADLLLPLFFGTLNRPLEVRRATARMFGRVPFLNGGLFEPHPLERAHRAPIPNGAWRDAFDTLFERFHFTAGEGDAGAVAPDMLGRVFEGVMEAGVRRASGTFYTPRPIVRDLVDAALAGWVGGRLGLPDADAFTRLEAGDDSAITLLDDLAVLDPAVGSGAFLLGVLERLASLRAREQPGPLVRRIVARNLFGVDQNPAAVRLCELRLWLAVVAHDGDAGPESARPLPNLDAFVRQGDSLADPLRLMLQHPVRGTAHADALSAARAAVAASNGAPKRESVRLLRRLELETAAARLAAAIGERERLAAGLLASCRGTTLFGDRPRMPARTRADLHLVRRELHALRHARRRLVEDGVAPSFDYDTHFADVMARGGFDVVLGNPPWVRAEALSAPERARLQERFHWWRAGGGRGYRHLPDLSVAFVERAWELTRSGGILAMLVPAKFATATYAAAARAALADLGSVVALEDLTGNPDAAFDATTYPLGIVVRAAPAPAAHRTRLGLAPRTTAATTLAPAGAPWVARCPGVMEVLERLHRHPPLRARHRIQLGVKTGANHVFLDPPAEVESFLVRPLLRGRDIRPWQVQASGTLIWSHDEMGRPLASLPEGAARHFARHAQSLRRRRDLRGSVVWTLFRVESGARVPRVVWADLAPRLGAACLLSEADLDLVPLNSCYVIRCVSPREALALTAWLNSTWVRALARTGADVASGGYARFNARSVGGIPLPPGSTTDPCLVSLARRAIAGEALQEELDAVTGDRLGLTDGERGLLAEMVGVGTVRGR